MVLHIKPIQRRFDGIVKFLETPIFSSRLEVPRLVELFRADYLAQSELDEVVSQLKKIRDNLPDTDIKPFRTACLAKCASANLLEYKEGWSAKVSCVAPLAAGGKGECTEFATIAEYFGNQLGISTSRVQNTSHAFSAFYIKDQWYIAEPQDSSCNFFYQ